MLSDRGYGSGFRRDERRDDGYDRPRWHLFYVKLLFFFVKVNLCTLYILLNLDVINRSDRPRSPEGGRGM